MIKETKLMKLFNLGLCHLLNIATVSVYRTVGIDLASPNHIYAKLTTECNSSCNMCDVWRSKTEEISVSYWIHAFKRLKEVIGCYKISFAGGEVLLKNDVFEIFEFCHSVGLPYGITTNGLLLTESNVDKLLKIEPMNINISIDSLNNETYEKIRGKPFLETVKKNIEYSIKSIKKNKLKTKLFIKTVVNNLNLDELTSIAQYVSDKKLSGITFDPIKRRRDLFIQNNFPEFEIMYDIDFDVLNRVKKQLIELKKKRYNILNSEKNIVQWFNTSINHRTHFCSAPLMQIGINQIGDIRLCDFTETVIGNITCNDIVDVLRSNQTRMEKRKLVYCQNPCVYCIHRNLIDYIKIFYRYLK